MELLGASHLHCSLLPHLRCSPTAAAQQVALPSSFSRSCRSLAMPSSLPPLPPPLTTASTKRNPTIVFNAHSGGKPLRIIAEANAAAALVEDEAAPEDTRGIVSPKTSSSPIQVHTRVWKWQQHNIRYKCAGTDGPALILIHGFGANCDHWRKNIPVLARSHRVYAIDLLGYGFSDKPSPHDWPPNSLYTFETWARQILQFCAEVVKSRAFFICNSIGGLVGLQAALMEPDIVQGLLLLNISLRLLHNKKQRWYARPFVKALQYVLRATVLGRVFFKSVATPQAVKRILCECYQDDSAVTDELVEKILLPGLQPGAVDVFLDFLCYSGGPLPEELLPKVTCPVLIGWGEKDPWEPLALGSSYGEFPAVEEFIVLPNVGHCPQDEAPHLVNPLVERFVSRHATPISS